METKTGYIYIIRNQNQRGFIKIGYSNNTDKRLAAFNTSSVDDWELFGTYQVEGYQSDKQLHHIIEMLNPRLRVEGKEFFRMEPEEAWDILCSIAKITGTEDRLHKIGEPEVKPQKQKAEVFNFDMIDVPAGCWVKSIFSNRYVARVIDNKHIDFEGKPMSLSAAASIIYERENGQVRKCNGPECWKFNEVKLSELRKEC